MSSDVIYAFCIGLSSGLVIAGLLFLTFGGDR